MRSFSFFCASNFASETVFNCCAMNFSSIAFWIAGFSYVMPPNMPTVVIVMPRAAKKFVRSTLTASLISCFLDRNASRAYFAATSAAIC